MHTAFHLFSRIKSMICAPVVSVRRLFSVTILVMPVLGSATNAVGQDSRGDTWTWEIISPQPWQVFQRGADDSAEVNLEVVIDSSPIKYTSLDFRIAGMAGSDWRAMKPKADAPGFHTSLTIPSGGWYTIEFIAVAPSGGVLMHTSEPFGVGEVFVVAGQSNSANHGEERQSPASDRVVTFDGSTWRPAYDPQPGASGQGGSFLPPLGDYLTYYFDVPVAFTSCGIGATSVREWLPEGRTFPNPPTIVSRVRKLENGSWESNGQAFESLCQRMKSLKPGGFRAVLWHQGESDANQRDASRTLAGNLYSQYLTDIIRSSRKQTGLNVPWFVAQVSYHVPGDESSPDIRKAQASLWESGHALQGPDSDAIKGHFRENNGQGVHFSGPGLREHARQWGHVIAPWLEKVVYP